MSRQIIEERLIKLGIDNEQFKTGLKESLSSLEDLDKSLAKVDGKSSFANTEKATKSLGRSLTELMGSAPKLGDMYMGAFNKIGSAVGSATGTFSKFASGVLNFVSPITLGGKQASEVIQSVDTSVQQTSGKFSMLRSVASIALGNIAANAAMAGLSMAKNFAGKILHTIAPLKAGFGQFEDKVNSVNMLVAALGKSEMGHITGSLDELQKYAETTKYSVKQMHNSLAQFVNAGVGLDDATTALKGWGNLAASAGASTDGFNRSLQFGVQQALQMGMMNTQNWMSVENAGMATKRFKDILVETAKALGQNVDLSEGFRGSLKDGWLTNEVLIKSLEQLANDETLKKMASDFHTFGEAAEAVADQVTSGWARVWETLFGQAGSDELTAFWTKWGNAAANALSATADKANEFAKAFVSLGGRDKIMGLMDSVFGSIGGIFKSIGGAFTHVFGGNVSTVVGQKLVDIIGKLSEKLRLGSAELHAFQHIFIAVFQGLKWIGTEVGAKMKLIATLIPNHMIKDFILIVGMIAKALWTTIRAFEVFISKLINFSKIGKVFSFVGNAINKFWDAVHNGLANFSEKWSAAFDKLPGGVAKVMDWLKKFWEVIKVLTPAIGHLKQELHGFFSKIANPFKTLGHALGDNGKKFNEWSFWVGNAVQRFPIFGKALGKFIVGFSHFNDATGRMDSWAGQFGHKLRTHLSGFYNSLRNNYRRTITSHRTFWNSLNGAMDQVLNRQITTWKQFREAVKWEYLIPPGIRDMFKNFKFSMPDMSGLKKGFAAFASNPFGAIKSGTQGLSKWLENSTFSLKAFGDIVRKHWPTLGEYADKLDKVKFSLSFLKPVVDSVGKAFEWFNSKISKISFGKINFGGAGKVFSDAGKALTANFSEGIVPGIVKSIDGFRKWVGELGAVKSIFGGLGLGAGVIGEAFNTIRKEMGKSKIDFSNFKTTLETFKGWFHGFWHGLANVVSGDTFSKIGAGIKNGFSTAMSWISSTFGPWFKGFFSSLPSSVQHTLTGLWDLIKQFASSIGSSFKDTNFSFKNFGEVVDSVSKGVKKALEEIGKVLKKIWDGFKDLFKVTGVSADELTEADFGDRKMKEAEAGMNRLGDSVDRVHEKSKGVFASIGDMAKLLGETFSAVLAPFNKADSAAVGKILTLAAAIIVLWNTRKKVLGIKDMFREFGKGIFEGANSVTGSLTNMFKAISGHFKAKAKFQNIKSFALAIATLTGSLLVLAMIPADKLQRGVLGLVAVLGAFEVFYLTLSMTTKKFDQSKVQNAKDMMLGMLGVAGSILMISGSVMLLGKLDGNSLTKGLFSAGVILVAMGGLMAIMAHMQRNAKGFDGGSAKISIGILTFIGLAYAIKKVAKVVKDVGTLDESTLNKGLYTVATIIVGMSAVLLATGNLKEVKTSSVLTFITMAKAVGGISKAVAELGSLDTDVLLKGGAAVAIMLTVIAGIALAFSKLDNTKQSFTKNALVMFGGIAGMLYMMRSLAQSIGTMKNPDAIVQALGAMAVVTAAFGALAMVLQKNNIGDKGINEGIKNLAVLSGSVLVASAGLLLLSKMEGSFLKTVGACLALVGVVYAFVKIGQAAQNIKREGIIGLAATVGALMASVYALKELTTIPVDNILLQVGMLVGVVAAIATIGGLLGKFGGWEAIAGITALGTSLLMIGGAIGIASAGIGYFLQGIASVIDAITRLIDTVSRLGKEGGENFRKFFAEASKSSGDIAEVVAGMAEGMVVGMVRGISGNIGKFIDIGVQLIKGIIIGLGQAAGDIANALIEIVANAVEGLINRIPQFVINITDALLRGIQQIAQWFRNNRNVIAVAILEMFEAMSEVIIEAVSSLIGMILDLLSNIPLIGGMFEDAKKGMEDMVEGWLNMQRKAVDSAKKYAEIVTTEGITKAIETMDKLGPAEMAAAMRFAGNAKDGLEYFKIICSQLGIQGADEFINGLKNKTIDANAAGKLFAKMVEMGMSEAQVKQIAEKAGYDYANGVLTAKPEVKTNADDIKKTLEQGLGGDGSFDLGLLNNAFNMLNGHLGGKLDVTKAMAALKSGEIPQEMIQKMSEGDFSGMSMEQMQQYLSGFDGSAEAAGQRAQEVKAAVETGLSGNGNFDVSLVTQAFTNLDTYLGGRLDVTLALAALKTGNIPPAMLAELAKGDFSSVAQMHMDNFMKPVEAAPPRVEDNISKIKASALTSVDNMYQETNGKIQVSQEEANRLISDWSKGKQLTEDEMQKLATIIENSRGKAKNAAENVASSANKGLETVDGTPAGQKAGDTFGTGIESRNRLARDKASGIASVAGENMKFDASGSGAAIAESFAAGLAGARATTAVLGAAAQLVGLAKAHLPHSPAKMGPFSGEGWRKVKSSGIAIAKEFASGLGSTASFNAVSESMTAMQQTIKDALGETSEYLDDNMELSPVITPVLDMSNVDGYTWNGSGYLGLTGANINYSSLNPTSRSIASNRYSIDEVVRGLNNVDQKLATLTENSAIGNDLLAQGQVNPIYLDKDLVNRALAPGMADAQRTYSDRLNMLDGVLPRL